MSDFDAYDEADKLLGRFDFALEIAAKDDAHRAQMRALLLSFIEVLDSFDRFFAGITETEEAAGETALNWLSTFRLIGRQLETNLSNAGVKPIPCMGETAEPGKHEIIGVMDAPGTEKEIIVKEASRGYEWDGEIIRKPRVIVAKGVEQHTKEE
jgi:molecular chaperone GrpE